MRKMGERGIRRCLGVVVGSKLEGFIMMKGRTFGVWVKIEG